DRAAASGAVDWRFKSSRAHLNFINKLRYNMFYSIVRIISWILLKIFWQMKVEGFENIPKKGAVIIASNHVSYLDPAVLVASLNRKIYFITKKEVFKNTFISFILKNMNAFSVDRENVDILAFKKAINILREEKVLGIFPEGTRSSNGELQELKLGTIKIAMKTGVPILPAGIIGTHKIYPRSIKFPILFRHKITVKYGALQYLNKLKYRDKIYQMEELDLLGKKIKELSTTNT
ncbi:MAG: lysophospholipid acyltransferase family protein, partial [Atribacterota bacterium]|nr:lysophospholipid acyltransferase family protein [Atribacterota bacterium]